MVLAQEVGQNQSHPGLLSTLLAQAVVCPKLILERSFHRSINDNFFVRQGSHLF